MKTIQVMLLLVLMICGSCVQWRDRHQKSEVLEIINPVVKPNTHYALYDQDTIFAYFDEYYLILSNRLDTFSFELDYATQNLYEFNIFDDGKDLGGLGIIRPIMEDEKGHEHFSIEIWFDVQDYLFLLRESTTFQPLE